MGKLSSLHEWLTLEKSADYLSDMLGESVMVTDLLRLTLNKKLTLSVRFLEPVPALIGKLINEEDFFTQASDENIDERYSDFSDSLSPIDTLISAEEVDDDTWFIYEDTALNINDIWDLTMLGLESIDVEKRYLNELGKFSYNPQRYDEQGIFVRNDTDVCKLLFKLEPSPVYEDKAFIGGILENFLMRNSTCFDECIELDYDTVASRLTSSELDHLTAIINLASISFPTKQIYKNCLTIEDYNHQLVIKTQELVRLIGLLKNSQQEAEPSAKSGYVKNNDKQKYNKAKTQAKYLAWQKQAIKLKKKHPNKTKSWIAAEVAKLPIAEGKSAETIRKNIKV